MIRSKTSQNSADICLLLESTYPYVRGGVSSWVHQLITGLSEFTFALVFIGSKRSDYNEICYDLPDNVSSLQTHFIMETDINQNNHAGRRAKKEIYKQLNDTHSIFRERGSLSSEEHAILTKILTINGIGRHKTIFFDEKSWQRIRHDYITRCDHPSFIEYFWLIRTLHLPIFLLASLVSQIPHAQLYHSISTGYAGFLGSLLQQIEQKPLMLSEHGIYTKERKLDIIQASWIADKINLFKTGMDNKMGYLHTIAIRFFETLGKLTYDTANPVIALSQSNQKKQIEYGALPETTVVIPNGINLKRFKKVATERDNQPPAVLGFIGRVVPIKDVKTFIRAIRILCNYMPKAQGWIIGPENEDQKYADECKTLANSLDLQCSVQFLGFQSIDDFLPKLGLLVLTSISEGQPLVILEAFASGLPVIATDVGFCREMIEGDTGEDRELGTAGIITPIADPSATAHAAIEMLGNVDKWRAARRVAETRASRYYCESLLFEQYRTIYNKKLHRNGRNRI